MSLPEADEIMGRAVATVNDGLLTLGGEIRDDLRERLGIPVGHDGGKTIRSEPGEYPRKETGGLSQNVTIKVEAGFGDVHRLTLTLEQFYANFLNDGTSVMRPRPIVAPFEEEWRGIAESRMAEVLATTSGTQRST